MLVPNELLVGPVAVTVYKILSTTDLQYITITPEKREHPSATKQFSL
jgi:hypothetical protein